MLTDDLKRIIAEMRNERPRYKSHDLGYVDSVSASNVDDWADELEGMSAEIRRLITRVQDFADAVGAWQDSDEGGYDALIALACEAKADFDAILAEKAQARQPLVLTPIGDAPTVEDDRGVVSGRGFRRQPVAEPERQEAAIGKLHRYTITSEGASVGYFRLVEDVEGAWVSWAEVEAFLARGETLAIRRVGDAPLVEDARGAACAEQGCQFLRASRPDAPVSGPTVGRNCESKQYPLGLPAALPPVEPPPVCPHCHLPATMPEVCTPELHAALEANIARDWTLYEAGYDLGKKVATTPAPQDDRPRP